MDAGAAIALLERVSIYELSGTDGCLCMSCEIQGISIDVSCRKSGGSGGSIAKALPDGFYGTVVRVHSRDLEATAIELQRVADVVCEQIRPDAGHLAMAVRLCSYEDDEKSKCWYCGEPRLHASGYGCAEHPEMTDAVRDAAWDKLRAKSKE